MKYLKIVIFVIFLFTAVIRLTACGGKRKNPMPSFQPKDTIATTENENGNDGLPDDLMYYRIYNRCSISAPFFQAEIT